MMTDRDNFLAATEHRRPERTLFYAGFTPDLHRRVVEHIGTEDIGEHYGFWRCAGLPVRRPDGVAAPDYTPYWEGEDLPEGTTFNEYGVAQIPSGFYHFWGYVSPLRNATSLADIEQYPLDDMSDWDFSYLTEIADTGRADGRIVTGWVGHMYETAWQIRGYEQFLLDTIERPAWAQCLLDRLAEQNMHQAVAFARAGVDLIQCGDDVANQNAMMFAPDTWRTMMHSRWAEIWAAVKAAHPATRIKYHSDGNILAIVDDLVDAGLDILNPVQPECLDADEIHRRYAGRLSFDGCIGTQSTMPFGTPDDVRARVKEVVDKFGQDGGLILAPTHVLEPEVPLANIDAFADACREYGTFV